MRRQVVFGLMCGILAWVGSFGSEDFDPLPPIVSRNGTAAPQGKYPFLVFLSIQFAGPVVQNCTGVLISERHVITSESCFFHSNGERIVPFKDNDVVLVHAGVVNRSLDEGQFRLTSNVSSRFGDSPLRSRFGITVITVEPFDLTNQIQPIGLAGWEDAVVLPYKALYVGWGTVGWNLKSNTRQLTEEVMDAVLPFALSVRQPLTGLMTIPEGEFATNVYKEVVTYVPHLGNALLKQVKNKHVLMGVVLQDANYAIQPKIVSAEGIWYYCKQIKVETEGQVKCG
ncbi:hypothetical protein L596_030478 [Steinernema carpocapsae]|uniref:Peptidase S1 domain-containing protein n=1 Tax=Steinernema carpocapsae TaxID=34508 RepID=A0A4U5LPH9_STECR|nr:hypothetical protein L596_030478 [Steinernema carpocapsae]